MKKRAFVLSLSAVIAASALWACGGASSSASSGAAEEKSSEVENNAAGEEGSDSGKLQIAFVPQLIGIPYFTAMDEGGKQAAEELGFEWIYSGDTTASADLQVAQMDSLIRRGVDAISLSVLDSSSTNPSIEKAQEAGITTYTTDSDAPDSSRDFYVAQADDQALGEVLMENLCQQIGGSGKVGIVSGGATATNLNAWISAMTAYAEENYPDVEILDVKYTSNGSSEEALQQAQNLMTANPDIKGLVAVASSTIPGVCQAVEQAGKTGEVKVIGYGSPNTVREYIESGIMETSVLWDAKKLGYLTAWAGYQAASGNAFEESMTIDAIDITVSYDAEKKILLLGDPLVITKDNVADYDF